MIAQGILKTGPVNDFSLELLNNHRQNQSQEKDTRDNKYAADRPANDNMTEFNSVTR